MNADARTGRDRRQRSDPWPFPERRLAERRLAIAGGPAVRTTRTGFSWGRVLVALADPWFKAFALVFVAGQFLDLATTYYAIGSGRFQEGNLLFAGAVDAHSPTAALSVVLIKVVVAVGVITASALEISSVGRRRLAVGLVAAVSLLGPIPNLLRVAGLI